MGYGDAQTGMSRGNGRLVVAKSGWENGQGVVGMRVICKGTVRKLVREEYATR